MAESAADGACAERRVGDGLRAAAARVGGLRAAVLRLVFALGLTLALAARFFLTECLFMEQNYSIQMID